MFLQNIKAIEKRTFLEFVDLDEDAGVQEEHGPLMCRAKTETAMYDKMTVCKAAVWSQAAAESKPKSTESSPKSSVSTAAPSCAEKRGSYASSTSSSSESVASEFVRESPSKDVLGEGRALKEADPKTTLMLRNLPNDYTRDMFLDMLDDECLAGEYDFVYFPVDFQTGFGLGYAFVNFTSHEEALRAWQLLDGYDDWFVGSTKVCEVRWSTPVQGFKANVQRYRNSPLMHHQVPDSYKPMVFENGARVEYPAPKKPIKYYPGKKSSKHRN